MVRYSSFFALFPYYRTPSVGPLDASNNQGPALACCFPFASHMLFFHCAHPLPICALARGYKCSRTRGTTCDKTNIKVRPGLAWAAKEKNPRYAYTSRLSMRKRVNFIFIVQCGRKIQRSRQPARSTLFA